MRAKREKIKSLLVTEEGLGSGAGKGMNETNENIKHYYVDNFCIIVKQNKIICDDLELVYYHTLKNYTSFG